MGGGADAYEEATAMVDINAFRNPPAGQPQQPPAQQPFAQGGAEQEHEATQMVDINAFKNPPPMSAPTTPSAPPSFGAQPAGGGSLTIGGAQGGDDFEASTQFVDLASLASGPPPAGPGDDDYMPLEMHEIQEGAPSVVADHGASGYEGSTQFVDLNALAAGAVGQTPGVPQVGDTPPEQDQLLQQSYLFTPDAIQMFGQHTLIFARNQAGEDVVLKRVWQGHPDQMPQDLRVKLQQLATIQHPNLAAMKGLFASHSGAWVELERPSGGRLTFAFQQGPQSKKQVAEWAGQVAAGLQAVHAFSVLYNNLTPDAVWFDLETGVAKIEPFDALAFEDRGTLGAYGAPELQNPAAPPTPATDVFSFAALVVHAMTGLQDPAAYTRIEDKKLVKALAGALELDPAQRSADFTPLLKALGAKAPKHSAPGEAKEGLDKRLLIPVAIIAVALIAVMLMSDSGPQERVIPPQLNIPEMPSVDRVAAAEPPGAVASNEKITILTSYSYNPPDEEKVSKDHLEEDEIVATFEKARMSLANSKKYVKKNEDYRKALENFATATRARGDFDNLNDDEYALFDELMATSGLRTFRHEQLQRVEKLIFSKDRANQVLITYRNFALIDPNANASSFLEKNGKAPITIMETGAEPAGEENP